MQSGKTPQPVSWIWYKTIWWWGSSNTGALGNVEYPFIAIALRSTQARSGKGLFMDQIELNFILMLNWIVWKWTVYIYKKGFGINNLQWLMCHKTKPNLSDIKSHLNLLASSVSMEGCQGISEGWKKRDQDTFWILSLFLGSTTILWVGKFFLNPMKASSLPDKVLNYTSRLRWLISPNSV